VSFYLGEPALVCALGGDVATVRENLFAGRSPGLVTTDRYSPGRPLPVGTAALGAVAGDAAVRHRSRNNRLLAEALVQLRPSLDPVLASVPRHRIAVVLGTSTSGMAETEQAIIAHAASGRLPPEFHLGQQELGSGALFLAETLGVTGPAFTVSTACSSSAKAIASGARLLAAGLADVVIAGGADTLCRFTMAGFAALEALSPGRSNPFSVNRDGINIGEGAALFVLSRTPGPVRLTGWGEASDGYHVSAPDPEGRGARRAIEAALTRAGDHAAGRIGYVNLHGTGTRQNDAMESRVVHELLPSVPASATKPLTGHTLGAAGAIEAAFCWLTLTDPAGRLPPHLYDGAIDPELPALDLVAPGTCLGRPPAAVVSTSFAFGGSNVALVLEHA
jgi:3-oxoacyl-[acyl-carrier-protein] synthase-1